MFFNNLHSAKLAQKSNLTYYEEAEDSDKVDNLGEKKKEELDEIPSIAEEFLERMKRKEMAHVSVKVMLRSYLNELAKEFSLESVKSLRQEILLKMMEKKEDAELLSLSRQSRRPPPNPWWVASAL